MTNDTILYIAGTAKNRTYIGISTQRSVIEQKMQHAIECDARRGTKSEYRVTRLTLADLTQDERAEYVCGHGHDTLTSGACHNCGVCESCGAIDCDNIDMVSATHRCPGTR